MRTRGISRLFGAGVVLANLVMLQASSCADTASADTYPSRPVKIIAAIPPGSANDVIARLLAQKLSERAGAPFLVENLPGAGQTIGTGAAARAAADGYTILIMNPDFVIQPLLKSKVPYDPFTSFTPVTTVAAAPETIVVNPSLPVKNMKELIELLRANPGKYSYASPGYGTSPHLASDRLFRLSNGIDIVHVPFQGGAPAVTSTIGGHTAVLHITLPLVASHVNEGTLRALAVASSRRTSLLPDVPTLAEAGFPNHDVEFWTGLVVPTGTPKVVIEYLYHQVAQILALSDVKDRLATIGFEAITSTPEEFAERLKEETELWRSVVRKSEIKID